MNERTFNDWLARLPALTVAQKQRLETPLAGSDPATSVARDLDRNARTARPARRYAAAMRVVHLDRVFGA